MGSMVTGLVGLFVLFAVGPALGRGLYRLLQRVPILGAVAALGLLLWVEGPAPSAPATTERPTWQDLRVPTRAWSPDDPRAAHTTDEDLPGVYRSERQRYAREVASAKARVQAWLGF